MTVKTRAGTPAPSVKRTVTIIIVLGLIAASIFLVLGGPTGIAARPGIFGTKANLFSDLNLIAQILLLSGLGVGFYFARKGNITAHQYIQTGMVLFNIVLTVFIMVVAYVEYVIPGMPQNLPSAYGLVSTIHAIIGLAAIACGIYLLLRMNKLIPVKWRVPWWRKLMRVTIGLYWIVGLLGLAIYYVWYMR
jgi:uncharacterized membrane protein YozB (DUF420 family)